MDYKTIEGVPLVTTGTYPLGSGETTFTADDLASAVLAANDPTVSLPRIKIGHTDERFEADPALDGEPAMGTVRNLTLTDDGQTIIGDLCDVPAWLADSMPSAFPGRSIEGGFGYTAPSGHAYKFVISDLALLGTTWPGIGSLPDLRDVMQKNGVIKTEAVEAASERFVMAKVGQPVVAALDAEDEAEVAKLMREGKTRAQAVKIVEESTDEKNEERDAERKAKASLDVGGIPRVFAADLTAGKVPKGAEADQSKWWPRSVEALDDGSLSILVDASGKLLRLPITVADKTLTYGEPTPVAASTGALDSNNLKGPRVLASWPSNPTATRTEEVKRMKITAEVDQAKLAKRLGLPEDADEAAINAALSGDAETPNETATAARSDAAAVSTSTEKTALPDGVVAIDAETLGDLQTKAEAGATIAAKLGPLGEKDRDDSIRAAIKGGRIAAGRREHFEKRWEVDPEGTRTLLTASVDKGGLAPVIPVDQVEAGFAGDGEGANLAASAPRLFTELNETTTEVAA